MDMDIDDEKSAEKPKLNPAHSSLVAEGNSRIGARENLESIAQKPHAVPPHFALNNQYRTISQPS